MTFVVVANLDDLEVGDTMLVERAARTDVARSASMMTMFRAIHNTCTHQQQPLHEGTRQDDDTLVCAAHASRYDLTTGEAVGVFAVADPRFMPAGSKTTPFSLTLTSSCKPTPRYPIRPPPETPGRALTPRVSDQRRGALVGVTGWGGGGGGPGG